MFSLCGELSEKHLKKLSKNKSSELRISDLRRSSDFFQIFACHGFFRLFSHGTTVLHVAVWMSHKGLQFPG